MRLDRRHLNLRAEWLGSPEIRGQIVLRGSVDEKTTSAWFERIRSRSDRIDIAFTPRDRQDPVAMGGLIDLSLDDARAELYVFVAPALQGRGFGRDSVQWLCNYGFHALRLNRIYLHTMADNARARRLYEALGFTHEGVLRNHVRRSGSYVDRHVYGLLASEWQGQAWAGHAALREPQ